MGISYRDDYYKMDEEYEGQLYRTYANSLLASPADTDASRMYMNTAETKQSLTLLDPDPPRLMFGWENPLGRLNKDRSYKQLDGTWVVKDIIRKFENGDIFTVVFYNPDKDLYDMIEAPLTESLNEKFGYMYDISRMKELEIGDEITDEVIYKSTSYKGSPYHDKYNYCYGKNAKVMYSTSTGTIEDAVMIRKGWADGVKSVEVVDITASVNNNHIPLNIYGDDENYKVIPDLNEQIKDSTLFALRMANKDHILIGFNNEALKNIQSTDTEFYVSEADTSYVYDIDIFYNSPDPFPDNVFFHQLKGYYDQNCVYADRMAEWAKRIKESGSNYTDNIPYYKSLYQNFNNPEYKWVGKEKNKPFGYMVIQFKVISIIGLVSGSKVAGRYGDKGVIAKVSSDTAVQDNIAMIDSILDMLGRPINDEEREKIAPQINIVPDSEMPYTDDFPIDIVLNASGAIRRLNPGQLYEVDINFCSEWIRKKICELPTLEEKMNLAFEYLGMINEDECGFFYKYYNNMTQVITMNNHKIVLEDRKAKEAFIRDIEEHGFYIVKPHDSNIRYATLKAIYERFDFIKPLPAYIDIFGTKKRRIAKDIVAAEKYIMILKHNNNKNFSARSTYRVNRANLPAKDTSKRNNRSQYSKSPVRIGEAYNLMSAISGALLAEYNIFMRSSTLGRKSLKRILETEGNPLEIKRMKIQDNFINANAEIFNARLKGIGLRVHFVEEGEPDASMVEDVIMPLRIGNYTIYDTPLKKQMYVNLFTKWISFMEQYSVMESYIGEKKDLMWDKVFELPEVQEYQLDDDIKNMLKLATKSETVDVVKELQMMRDNDTESEDEADDDEATLEEEEDYDDSDIIEDDEDME